MLGFRLSVGDIRIVVVRFDSSVRLRIADAIECFLVKQTELDVVIRAGWGDLSKETDLEKVYDSGSFWQLCRVDETYFFRFSAPVFGATPYKIASFNQDFDCGEVRYHRPFFSSGEPLEPLEYPLDQLLMVNLLARGRGALVHGCGAVDSVGNGHLFVGQSGAGKTTIARILDSAGGMTILSDDRIILRKLDGTMWMYGTPWHGEARFASPARAPLAGIYFLARGPKNELVLQKSSKAVGRLFACSFPLFYDPKALEFTLSFLDDVAKTAPCYELRFVPDEKVVNFLKGQMA